MTKMNRNDQNFTTNACACGWASSAAKNSVAVCMDTVFAVSIFVISIISIISISIIGLRLYGFIIMLIMGTIKYLKKQKVKTKTVLVV